MTAPGPSTTYVSPYPFQSTPLPTVAPYTPHATIPSTDYVSPPEPATLEDSSLIPAAPGSPPTSPTFAITLLDVTRPFYQVNFWNGTSYTEYTIKSAAWTNVNFSDLTLPQQHDIINAVQAGILKVYNYTISQFLAVVPYYTGTFAGAVSGTISGYAPLASPTFTGTVTEPTPVITGATVTTTAPSAGAAAALPATPAGYIAVSINGTVHQIAYY